MCIRDRSSCCCRPCFAASGRLSAGSPRWRRPATWRSPGCLGRPPRRPPAGATPRAHLQTRPRRSSCARPPGRDPYDLHSLSPPLRPIAHSRSATPFIPFVVRVTPLPPYRRRRRRRRPPPPPPPRPPPPPAS
eukprot:4969091-Pyramimonas_sp.AAC.1